MTQLQNQQIEALNEWLRANPHPCKEWLCQRANANCDAWWSTYRLLASLSTATS